MVCSAVGGGVTHVGMSIRPHIYQLPRRSHRALQPPPHLLRAHVAPDERAGVREVAVDGVLGMVSSGRRGGASLWNDGDERGVYSKVVVLQPVMYLKSLDARAKIRAVPAKYGKTISRLGYVGLVHALSLLPEFGHTDPYNMYRPTPSSYADATVYMPSSLPTRVSHRLVLLGFSFWVVIVFRLLARVHLHPEAAYASSRSES
ncbi:hypothetical protein GLOTRDRAFT_123707 [Gloeophyllum trabeum ATCC 11539]|uniref:Uncharacterized protein n=1 Tax=Gloeophyllum trabeum (strain ATCC 11539 / FP-39264 / Madison 617) TaxID=670483 RepID=S7QKN7_GLOTA|nr:uncharacterized protein GLOTRDRAFT_123707 [Gloeophyllum trabeum ATCC 11539]EPQ59952.1 hypothetical protein GLOTRDRAFT_123707 [Gloeophyllum trabeum ATCC 11539]